MPGLVSFVLGVIQAFSLRNGGIGEESRNRVAEKRFVAPPMARQEVIVAPEISPEEGRNSTRPNSTLDLKSIPINPHDRNYRYHKPNFVRSVISSSDHPAEEEAYAACHDCVRHKEDGIPVWRRSQIAEELCYEAREPCFPSLSPHSGALGGSHLKI